MNTKFAIGQYVWVMHRNIPVRAKVEKILIESVIEYYLTYKWERAGEAENFIRYEKDIAESKEELMELVFAKAKG
jgi:hypothetical protein